MTEKYEIPNFDVALQAMIKENSVVLKTANNAYVGKITYMDKKEVTLTISKTKEMTFNNTDITSIEAKT